MRLFNLLLLQIDAKYTKIVEMIRRKETSRTNIGRDTGREFRRKRQRSDDAQRLVLIESVRQLPEETRIHPDTVPNFLALMTEDIQTAAHHSEEDLALSLALLPRILASIPSAKEHEVRFEVLFEQLAAAFCLLAPQSVTVTFGTWASGGTFRHSVPNEPVVKKMHSIRELKRLLTAHGHTHHSLDQIQSS